MLCCTVKPICRKPSASLPCSSAETWQQRGGVIISDLDHWGTHSARVLSDAEAHVGKDPEGKTTVKWRRQRARHLPHTPFTSYLPHLSQFCTCDSSYPRLSWCFLQSSCALFFLSSFLFRPACLLCPRISLFGSFSLSFSTDCPHIHLFMLACSLIATAGLLPKENSLARDFKKPWNQHPRTSRCSAAATAALRCWLQSQPLALELD